MLESRSENVVFLNRNEILFVENEEVFRGMSGGSPRMHVADDTAKKIDEEVRRAVGVWLPYINIKEVNTLTEDQDQNKILEKKEEAQILHMERSDRIHAINQLLRAYSLYEQDVEYIVQDGDVIHFRFNV